MPLITIVVSIHHPDTVHAQAAALGEQGIPPHAFEVIVANSTALAVDHGRLHRVVETDCPGVHFVYAEIGPHGGRARALNFGLRRARAPLLWFLADDFIPPRGSMRAHIAFHLEHRNPRDAAVGGGFFSPHLRHSFLRRSIEDTGSLFGHSFTDGLTPLPSNFFYAANTSIKLELARAAGCFNERFSADAWDDYDYGLRLHRLGYRARLLPDAACLHRHRVTLGERLTQLRYSGAAAAVLETTRPGLARSLRAAVRRADRNRTLAYMSHRTDWRDLSDFDRLVHLQSLYDRDFAEGYREALVQRAGGDGPLLDPTPVENWLRSERASHPDPRVRDPLRHADPHRMQQALTRQRDDDFATAQRLYLEELAAHPRCVDALHMLGVLCLQAGYPAHGAELIGRAMEAAPQDDAALCGNLGLCLAEVSWVTGAALPAGPVRRALPRHLGKRSRRTRTEPSPLVSIIVPSYNHRAFVGAALSSVFAQSYRNLEVIVIDDGSRDGSPKLLHELLRYCPFPHRLVVRENRGAHRTINEGVELARGDYVNVLNSDDRFTPDRIQRMLHLVVDSDADWACGKVRVFDDSANTTTHAAMLASLDQLQRSVYEQPTLGFSFLRGNVAISSGNLFLRRQFAIDVGLFGDLRYNHDWEFCLRALWHSEPAYLPHVVYEYRLHEHNTITESRAAAIAEADDVLRAYLSVARKDRLAPNPLAPCLRYWGETFVDHCLDYGLGRLFAKQELLELRRRRVAAEAVGAPPIEVGVAQREDVAAAINALEKSAQPVRLAPAQ